MLGNWFGISLTLGHVIVGLVMVFAYDLILNVLPNPWSEWWTSRSQFPLRVLVFGVASIVLVLAQTNPLVAAELVFGTAATVGGWNWWQIVRRQRQRQQPSRESASQTQTRPAEPPAPTSTPSG